MTAKRSFCLAAVSCNGWPSSRAFFLPLAPSLPDTSVRRLLADAFSSEQAQGMIERRLYLVVALYKGQVLSRAFFPRAFFHKLLVGWRWN